MRGLYASSGLLGSPEMDNDAGIRIGIDWEPDAADLRVFQLARLSGNGQQRRHKKWN